MPPVIQLKTILDELLEVKVLLSEMNKYRFAEQYIDNDELTQLLKISKKTALLWRNSNTIPFAQLGKKIYYRLSDLEAVFNNEFNKTKRVKKKQLLKRKRIKQNPKSKGWTIKV